MPHCPKCGFESENISNKCEKCGFVQDQDAEESGRDQEDNIKWKKLHSQPGIIYVEMVKEVIEKRGIPCIMQSGDASALAVRSASHVGTRPYLLVPEDRFEECEKILVEMFDHI